MSDTKLGQMLFELIHSEGRWEDLDLHLQQRWESMARAVKRYEPEEDRLFKVIHDGFKRYYKEPRNNIGNPEAYLEGWFTSVVETHVFKQLEHGFEILGLIRQVFPVNILLSKTGYTLSIKEKNIEATSASLVSAIEQILLSLQASSLTRKQHAFVDTVCEKFKQTHRLKAYEPPQASEVEVPSSTALTPKAEEGDAPVPSTTPPPNDPTT